MLFKEVRIKAISVYRQEADKTVSSIIWIYFLTQSENKSQKNMFYWFLQLSCIVCNLDVDPSF